MLARCASMDADSDDCTVRVGAAEYTKNIKIYTCWGGMTGECKMWARMTGECIELGGFRWLARKPLKGWEDWHVHHRRFYD